MKRFCFFLHFFPEEKRGRNHKEGKNQKIGFVDKKCYWQKPFWVYQGLPILIEFCFLVKKSRFHFFPRNKENIFPSLELFSTLKRFESQKKNLNQRHFFNGKN